eukprot:117953_1
MSLVFTCDPGTQTSTLCTMAFNTVLFISTIPIIISFIHKHVEALPKPPKTLFCTSLTFMVCSSLALLVQIPAQLFHCIDLKTQHAESLIILMFAIFYSVQYYMLLVFLFVRLKVTFEGSIYKLSDCTTKIFKFLFIFNPFFITISAVIFAVNMTVGIIFIVIEFIITFGMTTSLVSLYIYKLIKVYKMDVDVDNTIYVDVITKITILSVVCILGTMMAPIPLLFLGQMNQYTIWTVNIMLSFDIYTNCICVVLTYSSFSPYYFKLCGCLDAKLKKKYRKTIQMMNIEVQSQEQSNKTTSESAVGKESDPAPMP